jgi:hypothetical protein
MELRISQRMSEPAPDGTEMRAAVVNENEVRAAAGLTMAVGAVAFGYAYLDHNYVPLRIVTALFLGEFVVRLTMGLRYSPMGAVAHVLTTARPPVWVAAKPKRFAWTLGAAMSLLMVVITNIGVRGTLPRTICLTCLTLMWMESVLGLCAGCKLYALLVRRGWSAGDPAFDVCARGQCEAVDA